MIELLNSLAQGWWNWMWPMFWQVSALVVFVGAIDLLLRRHLWPQVRYALWLLVLVKLITPPSLSLSTGIVSQIRMLADSRTTKASETIIPVSNSTPQSVSEINADSAGVEPALSPGLERGPAHRTDGLSEPASSGDVKPDWKAYLMTVWLAGIGTLSWWVAARFGGLRRRYGGKCRGADLPEWFGPLLTETARELRLRRLPEIALSADVASPAVFGTFRPVLVLPEATVRRLSPNRTEHILLHELAHIKRGDLIANTFYSILQIVYWFNPLLWLLRPKLQHLRELCCDATVARVLREKTPEYRETIMETARRLLARPTEPGIGLLGLFENSSRLRVRLNWLEKKTWRHRGLRIATIIAVVTAMSVCVLPMAKAKRTDPDKSPVNPRFSAALPNGITVEMIGVSTGPKQGNQWWRPDGSAMETAPYGDTGRILLPSPRESCREIAVRLSGDNTKDVSFSYEIDHHLYVEGSSKTFSSGKESLHAISFRTAKSLPAVNVKVGLAYGEWTTTQYDLDRKQTEGRWLMGRREFIAFDAHEVDGLARASFSHRAMRLATRVVALDETGKVHEGTRTISGLNRFQRYRYDFGLPLDRVSRFSLQVRPYRWVVFKNVSLQPGNRTNVLIDAGIKETFVAPAPAGPGPIGPNALSFDGVDDYLEVPAHPTLGLKPPFTIEMWIKPDFSEIKAKIEADKLDPESKNVLRSMWLARKFKTTLDPKKPAYGGFMMGLRPPSRPEFKCNGSFYIGVQGGLVQAGIFNGESPERWRPKWLHISQSCTRENYLPVPDQPLVIGESFKGEIAEVRIWNKVTTFEDLLLYGQNSLTGNEPNLVGCWDFSRSEGQIVHDIGPNANHARLGKWAAVDAADPNWVDL